MKISRSEWFLNGALVNGERLEQDQILAFLLSNIVDELRLLREELEHLNKQIDFFAQCKSEENREKAMSMQ